MPARAGASKSSKGDSVPVHRRAPDTDPAGGSVRRRKYGDPASEPAEQAPSAQQAAGRFCNRGHLAGAEAIVCVCATGVASMRAYSTFGWEAVGGDLAALAMLVAVCYLSDGIVHTSALYRNGADPGLLAGCTAVPSLFVALILRTAEGSPADLNAALFYLRLAVSCSGMFVVEGVLGEGKWGGEGTRWRDEVRPASVFLVLGGMAALKHLVVPWPMPLCALALALVLMRALLRCTPGSFTLGEASLICTGATLLAVDAGVMVLSNAGERKDVPLSRQLLQVDIAVESLLVGTSIVVALMWPFVQAPPQSSNRATSACNSKHDARQMQSAADMSHIQQESSARSGREASLPPTSQHSATASSPREALLDRTSVFSVCLAAAVGCVCLPPASMLLGQHFFVWVWEHMAESNERLALLAYWLAVRSYTATHA